MEDLNFLNGLYAAVNYTTFVTLRQSVSLQPQSHLPLQKFETVGSLRLFRQLRSGKYRHSRTVILDCWSELHLRVLQTLDKMSSAHARIYQQMGVTF